MNLTQEDWYEKLQADENAVILDVRTEDEWNDGIIPKAINIDIYKGQGFIYQLEELEDGDGGTAGMMVVLAPAVP